MGGADEQCSSPRRITAPTEQLGEAQDIFAAAQPLVVLSLLHLELSRQLDKRLLAARDVLKHATARRPFYAPRPQVPQDADQLNGLVIAVLEDLGLFASALLYHENEGRRTSHLLRAGNLRSGYR